MHRTIAALLASCALAACHASTPPKAYAWNADNAPEAYRGPADNVTVSFVSPEEVTARCAPGLPPVPKGLYIIACAVPAHRVVVLPNPCAFAATDYYAKI